MIRKLGSIIFLLLIIVGILLYAIFLPAQNSDQDKTVIIPKGAGIIKISAILHAQKILRRHATFKIAAKILGYEKKLKAGKYTIPARANNYKILKILYIGRPFEELVTIPEGVTSRKIASILTKHVNIDSTTFIQVVQDSAFAHKLGIQANSLEGYLFPNTYRIYWGISPRDAVKLMVNEFFKQLPDSAKEKAKALGFSLQEIITLASIIEGEAVVDSERVVISAVYHNRLRKGIRLQADPTIQYIIPNGPRRLLKADLQIDSPYNTYKYAGLPPGPINNPSRKSIVAALHPADVPYLYFVARGDGSHIFSVTYAQHRRAKRAFDKIRREVRRKQKALRGNNH